MARRRRETTNPEPPPPVMASPPETPSGPADDFQDDDDLDLPPGPGETSPPARPAPIVGRDAPPESAPEDDPDEPDDGPVGTGLEPGEDGDDDDPDPDPAPPVRRRPSRGRDTSPAMPESNEPERPIRGFDGTPYQNGADTFTDVTQLADGLGQIGNKVWYKIKRIEPRDLPSGEYGFTPMVEVRSVNPKPSDIFNAVREKYGGGGYEVWLFPNEDEREAQPIIKRIQIAGDWKPITFEGQAHHLRQMQMANLLRSGAPMTTQAPASTNDTSAAVELFARMHELSAAERNHVRQMEAEARARGDNSNAELLRIVLERTSQPKPSIFSGEGIAALASMLTPVVTGLFTMMKENRDRAEQRFEKLIEKMGEKANPSDTTQMMIEGVKSVLRVQEEQSKQMLQLHTKAAEQMLKRAGGDEAAGGFKEVVMGALAEKGPDLMLRLMDLGKMLIAMKAQRQQPTVAPAPAPHPVMPAATPTLPGQPVAPDAVIPAPTPDGQPAAPLEAAQPVAEAGVDPATGAPVEQPAMLDPRVDGVRIALQNMMVFTYLIARMGVAKHEVEQVWEHEHDDVQGRDLFAIYGGTPDKFRSRVMLTCQSADKLDRAELIRSVESWFVDFIEDPIQTQQGAALAHQVKILIDLLKADAAATEWLQLVLEDAPWQREEEDGDDED